MSTELLTAFDNSTLSLLDNRVDRLGNDVISESLKPSTDTPTSLQQLSLPDRSLVSMPSLDRSLAPFNGITSETVTDTKIDTVEVLDAPSDDLVLFDFDRFSLGNADANAAETLGEFSNDPIDYGDPYTDANYWRQQEGANSCAVVAQIGVYESLTGRYISEDDASNYAQQQGWFDPNGGTTPDNTGKILNVLGIETYQPYDTSLNSLASALAAGDKPIVGLDANEIWHPQYDSYGYPVEQADAGHAVWVTGIDCHADGSIDIIINDSGISHGRGSVINADDFMNAWQDYNHFVTVADNPFV